MASFTDSISQFNPYIQQLPVDAMVQVGMYKQAKYDEGVQKIQSYIDNISGIDVIKPEHKQYLQSKLNELGNNLRSVAAGDFSNQQLVNSVGGMATQVVKDPTIQKAVYSTARVRKGLEEMEADKKSGNYSPNNEVVFNDDVNEWLSDPDLNKSFNGEYSKFFDVSKFTREYFDKIKPGGFTTYQIFKTDSNGDPILKNGKYEYSDYMTTMETEGHDPKVVHSAINQILSDGRVKQQLSVDGRAMYRGYTGEALNQKLIQTKDDIIDNEYDNMLGTLLYKTAGYKEIGGQDIDSIVRSQEEKIKNTTSQYDELAKLALTNPNAVKAKMYTDDFISNNTTIYGSQKTKTVVSANPAADFQFKLTQEANRIQMDLNKLKNENYQKQLDRDQRDILNQRSINAMLLGKTLTGKNTGGISLIDSDGDGVLDSVGESEGGVGGGVGGGFTAGAVRQGEQSTDINDYINAYELAKETSASNFSDAQTSLLWNGMFRDIPSNQQKLQKLKSANPGVSEIQLISQMIDRAKPANESRDSFRARWSDKAMNAYSAMTPAQRAANSDVVDSYNNFMTAKKGFSATTALDARINADMESQIGYEAIRAAQQSKLSPITGEYQGKKFTLNPTQQYDLALYMKANLSGIGINYGPIKKAGEAAGRRLANQGYGFLLDQAERRSGSVAAENQMLITGAIRGAQSLWAGAKDIVGAQDYASLNWEPILNLTSKLDDEVINKANTAKGEAIKSRYAVQPNLQMSLLTGDAETDKNIVYNLREFASTSREFGKNLATKDDVDNFNTNIQNPKFFSEEGGTLQARVIGAETGSPKVEIVLGTPTEGRAGALVISREEALQRGINPEALYEPPTVKVIRDMAAAHGGKTTPLPVKSIQNYYTGNTWLNKNDFPLLAQYPNDVKGNLFQQNGKWYGVLYVQTATGIIPVTTPGNSNLTATVQRLQGLQPPHIDTLLREQNAR
jgi:hypothetical protein